MSESDPVMLRKVWLNVLQTSCWLFVGCVRLSLAEEGLTVQPQPKPVHPQTVQPRAAELDQTELDQTELKDHETQLDLSYLDNGLIRVGADLQRGGSIGFLAESGPASGNRKRGNVVNVHDFGRWIGQSYYSGPKPFGTPHPEWRDWPWNPVSAGDVYGSPSQLVEHRNDGTTLYIKSIPMQWALQNVPADCQFETWITLEGRSVRVRNRLTNQRGDQTPYPAMDQELPAVYTIGKLHRLVAYTGQCPFQDEPLQVIPKRPDAGNPHQWSTFFATEHWAALVDEEDWGLGLIHPGVVRFIGGHYGEPDEGGPTDDSNGYMAPVRQEMLDHNIVYEFQYTLVLDTLTHIRGEAYKQRPASNLPDYRFAEDRQHWWLQNATDKGTPVQDRWTLKVEQDDPQLYGPEGVWDSKTAPRLFIRAAFRTQSRSAQLFWETAENPGTSAEQSVRFDIEPDGQFRTYEVDLSASPAYRGTIRRLRFDPVDQGNVGDTVEIESISAIRQ